MKKFLVLGILLAACVGCQKKLAPGEYVVRGTVGTWNAPAMAWLAHYGADGEVTDSVAIVDGKFEFRGTVDAPVMARLIVDYDGKGRVGAAREGSIKMFYFGEGETTITSVDSLQNATVASPVNDEHERYLEFIGGPVQGPAQRANAKFAAATEEQLADTTFIKRIDTEFRAELASRAEKQKEYARANPASYFSVVALSESSNLKMDADEVEAILNGLDPKLQATSEAQDIKMRIDAVRNIIVGKPAPDFTQNTVDGRAVSLSDFRGKYVLLDFWASWCGPCRAESPFLVRAIETYGDKGFDVLGVSLDKEADRDAWIKAMADDGYTWTNISDLKGWSNEAARLYGVRAIPQNYLIDPEGIIVASNLRGEKLLEKLDELF